MNKEDLSLWLVIGILILILFVLKINVPVATPKYQKTRDTWTTLKTEPVEVISKECISLGEKAKSILPNFPSFPTSYNPPTDKGSYDSLGEHCCVDFMKQLFPEESFPKVRPSWLKNPKTNCCLELDGYSEKEMLAVEYNGEQHYNWNHYYNSYSKEKFQQMVERDQVKRELCKKKGIYLITVPYTIAPELIPYYIYSQLLDGVAGLKK